VTDRAALKIDFVAPSVTVNLDGLAVSVFRGDDGKLVVEIDGTDLKTEDMHEPHAIPNFRLWINEQKIEIAPGGELIIDDKLVKGTA
jgi:hypothetical protein